MTTVRAAPALMSISEIIRLYGLRAKQQLSQNFILDLNVTAKISRSCACTPLTSVLEIGPGPGSLTRSLLSTSARKVAAIELDQRFLPALNLLKEAHPGRFDVYHGDAVRIDEARIVMESFALPRINTPDEWSQEAPLRIVGNLPFGVATTLLLKWLRQIPDRSGVFAFGRAPLVLMFQAEVAERLSAGPRTKEYGRISVMTQRLCDVELLYTLPPTVFVPAPKVSAGVVRMTPRVQPRGKECSVETLERVCQVLFSQRRKTLRQGVKAFGSTAPQMLAAVTALGLGGERPEALSVEQFTELAALHPPVLTKEAKVRPVRTSSSTNDRLT